MIKTVVDRLRSNLPEIPWPSIGRDVAVPVYVIHNSLDAEDYFFFFDFEQFVEASKGGIFVRPKLDVTAGRDDFDRQTFGRQFREVFAREFDDMRVSLKDKDGSAKGWIGWGFGWDLASAATGFVANVVLLVALGLGRKAMTLLPSMLRGKSAEAKMEDEIGGLRAAVDAALAEIDVSLHPELFDHAFAGHDPGARPRPDGVEWPLPVHVRGHLDDQSSGSVW